MKSTKTREEKIIEAKKILQYNRKRIYRLPKKYAALKKALEPVEQDLLDIIAYWLKRDCIAYGKHDMVYFLSTHNGTYAVRRKTTRGVTNKHLNYLCALGLLQKVHQAVPVGKKRRYMRKQLITKVSRNMMRYKSWKLKPINTFEVFKYTKEVMDWCNENAKRLMAAKITPGNISYNQMAVNGLEWMAYRTYLQARPLSVARKNREYRELVKCIDFLIQTKGYTTKEEVLGNCRIPDKEIQKLFINFKLQLCENRNYKRPTKEQKERFGLTDDTWIITMKECGK